MEKKCFFLKHLNKHLSGLNNNNCFAFVLQLLDDINDRDTDVNYNHVHTNGIDKTFEEIKIFINKSYDLLKKYKLNSPLWREIFEKLLI